MHPALRANRNRTMSNEATKKTPPRDLLKRLYRAVGKFRETACWNWMWDSDLFGVRNPADGVTAYCCIMGRNGEHFAIAAYPGSKALKGYYRLRDEDTRLYYIDAFLSQTCLTASFEDEEELDDEDKRLLKRGGYRASGPLAWPKIRSHSPGLEPWHVNAREAEFLIHIFEQAIQVALRFKDNPGILTPPGGKGYLVRVPERGADGPKWRDAWIKPVIPGEDAPPDEPLDEVRIARIRKSIARTSDTWEIECFYAPGLITGEGGRAYFPYLMLCVDHDSPTILGFHSASPSGYRTEFTQELMGFIEKTGRLPETILTGKKETERMLEPVARALGIDIELTKDIEGLMEAAERLLDFFSKGESIETDEQPPGEGRSPERSCLSTGFEEMGSMEVDAMLFSPFDPKLSPLLIDTNVDDASIRKVQFLDHIHRYLDLIREREPVKLTQKGNLPLKLVRELRDMNFPAFDNPTLPDISIRSEENAPYIHLINVLTRLAGFTKKRYGKLTLTKKFEKTFARYSLGELYRHLLEVYTIEYNWAYEDLYEGSWIIQRGFAFSLLLVDKYGGEKRNVTFYADRFLEAFPFAIKTFPGSRHSTPRENFESCFCTRLVERFMKRFGLIDIAIEGNIEWKPESKFITKTELFDRLIGWQFSER